jgi:hypothetical protein
MLRAAPADKELLAVLVFKLADEHPLTKASLRCVYEVADEIAEGHE